MPSFGTAANSQNTIWMNDPADLTHLILAAVGTVWDVQDAETNGGLGTVTVTPLPGWFTLDVAASSVRLIQVRQQGSSGDWFGPIWSAESTVAAVQASSQVAGAVAAAAAASASASAASSAATAAQAAAASAIPSVQRGAPGGVATLDASGDMPVTQVPQSVLDDVAAALAGGGGGGGGYTSLTFEHSVADGSLVAGDISWGYPVLVDSVMDTGPVIDLDDYGTTASVFEPLVNLASIYSGTKPTVPIGDVTATGAAPTTQSVPAGSRLASKVVSVAAPGAAGGSAAVVGTAVSATGADQRASGGANTVVFVVPTLTIADVVVASINHAAIDTITTPAGWTLLGSQVSGALNHERLSIYAAQWGSGLTGTFSSSGTSNAHGHLVPVTNADAANLGQLTFEVLGEGSISTGATLTSPAWTATEACDVGLIFLGTRFPPTADGWRPTWAAGPAGLTEIGDSLSHRGAASIDIGAAVAKFGAVAAAATPTQANITFTYTAYSGSVSTAATTATVVAAVLGIKRAAGSHGPSRALVTYKLTAA